MADQGGSDRIGRRAATGCLLGAMALAAGIRAAPAQRPVTSPLASCIRWPVAGRARVTSAEVTVNNVRFPPCLPGRRVMPPLSVNVSQSSGLCTIGLAAGINITAEVMLAGPPRLDCGRLGFVQFARYRHQRSPSSLSPGGNYDCTQSGGIWELDGKGADRSYDGFFACTPGPNTIHMGDDPNVPVEQLQPKPFAYEDVTIFQWDQFRTWLIWAATDNNRHPSKSNPERWHPLARIDWQWQGEAINPGQTCTSTANPPATWDAKTAQAGVTDVLYGAAVGAPPARFVRTHNTIWVPGAC